MSQSIHIIYPNGWFAPDPAEQFHNPYLAMGNNPVRYIDPDGEFIFPALMFAGFIAGSMGTAAIADSKGIDMSGRELFASGLNGAAIGAMVASGVGAGAAKTVTTETVVTKVISKKAMVAKAGLKSGTINAISNHDFASGLNGFGLETLANFGAGFAGGALSVGSNWNFLGMMAGGGLNVGVGGSFNPGLDTYQALQRFAGGALSVYAGTGKLVKGRKILPKYELKTARTFLKYGAQSSVYDFAYTKKKYYLERNGWEHAGIFAAGGLSGVGAENYFTGREGLLSSPTRIGIGAGLYAAEWSVTSLIKQRSYADVNGYPRGGFYTGNSSRAKGWLLLDKWRIGSRGILGAQ